MNNTRSVSSDMSQTRSRKIASAMASGGSWNRSSMRFDFFLGRVVHALDVLAQHPPHAEARRQSADGLAHAAEPFTRDVVVRAFQGGEGGGGGGGWPRGAPPPRGRRKNLLGPPPQNPAPPPPPPTFPRRYTSW